MITFHVGLEKQARISYYMIEKYYIRIIYHKEGRYDTRSTKIIRQGWNKATTLRPFTSSIRRVLSSSDFWGNSEIINPFKNVGSLVSKLRRRTSLLITCFRRG